MRLRSDNFFLQQADLFEIGPSDLIASDVQVCICDAQYLRNSLAWDERYRGVRCRSRQHGVWALLSKQFWLAMTKLMDRGILIFRFGWYNSGDDDPDTVWYKRCTLRLFTLLHDLFEEVREVKSDHFNALQSSFYVCCGGFRRSRFEQRQVSKLLGNTFNYLVKTKIEDPNDLDLLVQVDKIRTKEVDDRISDMLDRIDRLCTINRESRKWHKRQEEVNNDPWAIMFMSPVPPSLADVDLQAMFRVYGRVVKIDRDSNELSVQFANLDQARTAAQALRKNHVFGDGVRIWTREEERKDVTVDGWSSEWAIGGPPTQAPTQVRARAPLPSQSKPPSAQAPPVSVTGEGPSAESEECGGAGAAEEEPVDPLERGKGAQKGAPQRAAEGSPGEVIIKPWRRRGDASGPQAAPHRPPGFFASVEAQQRKPGKPPSMSSARAPRVGPGEADAPPLAADSPAAPSGGVHQQRGGRGRQRRRHPGEGKHSAGT